MTQSSRRPLWILAALVFVLLLGRQAGVLPSVVQMRLALRRLLEPPTRTEMDQAARRDSVRQARDTAPTFTPLDPPVTAGHMLLWFAVPLAGTVALVFVTARRRR